MERERRYRRHRVLLGLTLAAASSLSLLAPATGAIERTGARVFSPPADSRQLILVTSPAYRPARSLATLRTYARTSKAAPWHPVFGAWTAEIGRTGLNDHKHEGDGSTPTGTFPVGLRMYGNDRNPGGLHYRYHRLVCGDLSLIHISEPTRP